MRFLKILFWVVVAAMVGLLAARNWRNVTIDLWGDLQADIKIPVLLVLAVLIGFLPTYVLYRAKLWGLQRRDAAAVAGPPPDPIVEHQRDEAP